MRNIIKKIDFITNSRHFKTFWEDNYFFFGPRVYSNVYYEDYKEFNWYCAILARPNNYSLIYLNFDFISDLTPNYQLFNAIYVMKFDRYHKVFKSSLFAIHYPRKFKSCFWPTLWKTDDTLILINGISRIALIFDQMV